ncbi:Peptide-N-glycosidase F, C terminal [Salegentibacter echinorum]|uniref:Peptide-N-glycosidase F, C terminal n=1 Tax=Salegentibacter echinorum TaxID=1073325 RepID=A0A1M5HXJ2_SALEC|nr:PNGase F N-terminal domain-containing protein [Salegentibacter echinorum]SHG20592.1 Peptide-N-glycosidase F, C terminal [Salegentibacter echinorum]
MLKSIIKKSIFLVFWLIVTPVLAQESKTISVFDEVPMNFNGEKKEISNGEYLQDGRIIIKKITVPEYPKGTDVKVRVTVKSAGDRWDKSGSLFVIPNPQKLNMLDIAKGNGEYPKQAGPDGYPGIKLGGNYEPALEVLRFMTPFGVGYYSDEEKNPNIKYNRPVYVPKWEDEVTWEMDVSQLESELTGEVLIGAWIDTWTPEGYKISVELEYSGRDLSKKVVKPLVNTVYYAGQKHPDLFAFNPLKAEFELPQNAKNAKLYYITTGHGGHSGGDEFIKLKNTVKFDTKTVLDTIPWRDDCASFRRFNPSSGVWTRKDSAQAYNREGKKIFREVEERLASSDLSRSNWCPGSKVAPYVLELGDLQVGKHELVIDIDATPIDGDKLNHWLVTAYLVYEE